jgi:hypothetical protein
MRDKNEEEEEDKDTLLHIQGIDNEMLEQKRRLIMVGGSKANVQCVCMCVLCRSEFRRCIVSTIKRKRKRKRHERKEESSSDDHISVADDDIVHHCLLKLDIFRSRHVLGKRIRTE